MKTLWLIAGLLANPAVAATATHCDTAERVVFSCTISGSKKVASLCEDPGRLDEVTSLQYRFGTLGRTEMIYPKLKRGSLEKFFAHFESHPALSMREIWFTNGSYEYLVASEGKIRDKTHNHIVVYKDSRPLTRLQCAHTLVNDLDYLGGRIPDANNTGYFRRK